MNTHPAPSPADLRAFAETVAFLHARANITKTLAQLRNEVERLRAEQDDLKDEVARLRAVNEQLRVNNQELQAQVGAPPLIQISDTLLAHAPMRWVTPDECKTESMRSLLNLRWSFIEMLQLAADAEGVPLERYAFAALAQAAKTTILETARREENSGTTTNIVGSGDNRIAEAHRTLTAAAATAAAAVEKAVADGLPAPAIALRRNHVQAVTPSAIMHTANSNIKAVTRWLLLHDPELLLLGHSKQAQKLKN